MHTLIIYCHPSDGSFTFKAKEAFVKGLSDSKKSFEVCDLYKINFNPVMTSKEYEREAYCLDNENIPDDVKSQQEKIDRADNIIFIFPNFWTSSPAMLEGWFQRVWTYGYAYGEKKMKILEKAVFLMTMGGSLKNEIRQKEVDAIKCTMISDRMFNRAKKCEFHVFDEMTRGFGNDKNRAERTEKFCKMIYELGASI